MLSVSQPNQLWHPTRIEEWTVIVRLEKLIPAVLDEPMRQKLLDNLFQTWLSEQVKQEMDRWRTNLEQQGSLHTGVEEFEQKSVMQGEKSQSGQTKSKIS
jgi:hypothetical protein